ncbi:MAG: transglycosylase domain-containing protein [Paludibacteraceae bacterium]|nr:transglycosylase domain-containing protein [Paludibacteraceae bacterium]
MAKKEKKGISLTAKILIAFWSLILLGLLSIYIVFSMIASGRLGYMPNIEELQNPKSKSATEIYSSDMKVIGRYYESKENRVNVPYEELSPHLVNALISTEDYRFREHSGIDGTALFRVLVKTLIMHQDAGGGSTISQQLAKLYFTEPAQSTWERARQKLNEWVIAAKFEKFYTKDEIISMYFNKFDFLNNAVGIKSASEIYFSSSPDKLKVEEAALLVGMCQNPAIFNPVRGTRDTTVRNKCIKRRNIVLGEMCRRGHLTTAEKDSLQQLPITLLYQKVDHKLGLAPYFRENLRLMLTAKFPERKDYPKWAHQKYYEDSLAWETNPAYGWCNKNQKPNGENYNIYTDGLKIYTTIDSRMQRYAEESVKEFLGGYLQPLFFKEKFTAKNAKKAPYSNKSTQAQVDSILIRTMRMSDRYRKMKKAGSSEAEIKKAFSTPVAMKVFSWEKGTKDTVISPMDSIRYLKSFLRTGMMSIDPFNGHVKAYVGGPDFNFFQYDMASVGRRQVGSTIKPFLYALAMENGMEPCDEVPNVQPQIPTPSGIWEPRNVPYGDAGKSEVGKMITIKRGLQTSNNWISAYLIKQYNPENFVNLLHSFGIKNKIDPVPSLCLGIADISVSEMVSAYTAFANKGIQTEPMYVTRIEDKDGNVIATFVPRMNEIFSEETAEKMIALLQGVINGGTGLRLRTRSYQYHIGWETAVAGKTGTTQNNSDGWFMGFVPTLITGVWVGGEDRDIHFDNLRYGQGSAMALPIWGCYMNKVYANDSLGYSRTDQFNVKNRYDCQKKEASLDPEAVEQILID